MTIYFVIVSLSMFFWIFPAVKQFKTNLFLYFLIYAMMDPITIIIISNIKHTRIELLFTFLLMLSVLWSFKYKKSIRILIAVVLSLVLYSYFSDRIFYLTLTISIHTIIVYFFIKRTFSFTANCGKVNIFHLFLLLEEISIILKISASLISVETGPVYSYTTTAFEILIAIFFTLYREDNPKLHIDLRSA
ncbi:MAG: hypothetical protein NTX65_07205 [Ignavibacteriales bacterium]|nr:hypothetical protein [Ignavibacteriales bacterium]